MSSTPLSSPATAHRIPSLDGLRALSIFLVVSLHTLQRFSLSHPVGMGWYALFNGAFGVYIFFVISGFLITTLLLQEHEKRGSISLRGFYLRRAFRILPPLYLYIGVIVLLGLILPMDLNRGDVLSSLFFFHNYEFSSKMWSLEHLWSISLEEQFYLVWPFLLVFFLRKQGVSGRYAASILPIVVLIVSPPLRIFLATRHDPLLHKLSGNVNFDFLMYGCLAALLQRTPRFEAIYRRATHIWWLPPAILVVCSYISARYQNYFDRTAGYTIEGAAIAIFLLWCTRNPFSAVGRVLNWKPVAQIGVLSYSIYLWQTLFVHSKNTVIFGPYMTFPWSWIGFLLAGTVSYYLVEQPSLRLRNRLTRAIAARPAAQQEAAPLTR